MAYLKDRMLDLAEAADIAERRVRDLLELGASGNIPLYAYLDHICVEWGVYDGEYIETQGQELLVGYFALEPEAIRRIAENGYVGNPWVILREGNRTLHGSVGPVQGKWRAWSVDPGMLRMSQDDVDRVRRQNIGEWHTPVDSISQPDPKRGTAVTQIRLDPKRGTPLTQKVPDPEQGPALTQKRNDWMYQRDAELAAEGMKPQRPRIMKILEELPRAFPGCNKIQYETVRRILISERKERENAQLKSLIAHPISASGS